MKRLVAMVALFYCTPLFAQHTREIGLFAEPPVSPTDVTHAGRIGLLYKYQPDTKKAYRFSASVGKLRIGTWKQTHYKSNDTIVRTLNSWYIGTNMPMLSAGIQWNKKLSKRLSWYYGTDVNAGFRASRKDSLSINDYAVISSGYSSTLIYSSLQKSKIRASVIYFGLQPFTGISAQWNRINTGMEISGLFVGSIITTTNEQFKSFRWGGFGTRVFVSYSFDNMAKK